MSQERTRFPIQPRQVRRSAQSNKDMDVPGTSPKGGSKRRTDRDKPSVPPHRRHDADETPDEPTG